MPRPLPVRLRGLPPLPDGREWLAVAPYSWARGTDLLDTVQRACDRAAYCQVSPARGPLVLFHVSPTTDVDGLGRLRWPLPEDVDPEEDPCEPVLVRDWSE